MKQFLRILFLIAAVGLLLAGGVRAWKSSCFLEDHAVPSDEGQPAVVPAK